MNLKSCQWRKKPESYVDAPDGVSHCRLMSEEAGVPDVCVGPSMCVACQAFDGVQAAFCRNALPTVDAMTRGHLLHQGYRLPCSSLFVGGPLNNRVQALTSPRMEHTDEDGMLWTYRPVAFVDRGPNAAGTTVIHLDVLLAVAQTVTAPKLAKLFSGVLPAGRGPSPS